MSSRSPSPLNTSLESSSTQSSPSPNSDRKLPESPSLPSYFNPLASLTGGLTSPMFDPLSLYRLSPLFARSSHLAQVQAQQSHHSTTSSPLLGMDFKQTLDLLAERRALFEKLKSEATCSSPVSEASESTDSVPVDLSVK